MPTIMKFPSSQEIHIDADGDSEKSPEFYEMIDRMIRYLGYSSENPEIIHMLNLMKLGLKETAYITLRILDMLTKRSIHHDWKIIFGSNG